MLVLNCALDRSQKNAWPKIRDQVQNAVMTYQAIDRIFYLLTGLSFALGLALALSLLLG
jgi:hypothetical protein